MDKNPYKPKVRPRKPKIKVDTIGIQSNQNKNNVLNVNNGSQMRNERLIKAEEHQF